MDDPRLDPIDEEYRDLLAEVPPVTSDTQAPALLIRRARDLREPLLGLRARFLMTSHTPDGEWLAHGWRDGLRIVSEPVGVRSIEEPAVWIQEERDFYGDCLTTNRIAVGLSRVWVEQYVSAPGFVGSAADDLWLDNLNRNPNAAEVRRLQPVQGHPDPVGRRVVLVGGTVETDLRAVSPVRMTDGGDLAITVIAERDWYRWAARDYPAEPHPTLRWEHAAQIWVE
jgi:hypothetical protein